MSFTIFLGIILVCPLIFFTNLTRNPYYIQGVLLNSGLSIILMKWILDAIKNKKFTIYRTPLDIPLIVFLSYCLFTWIRAFFIIPKLPIDIWMGKIQGYNTAVFSEGLRNFHFILINCTLAYYVSVFLVRDEKKLKQVFNAAILVAFLASIYGILQYFGIEVIWRQEVNPYGIKRCVTTFGNPNFFSSFLVLIIPISFAFFLHEKSSFSKFSYLILTLAQLWGLGCTMTRSSWIGLFFAFVIIFWKAKEFVSIDKKWLYIFLTLIILATLYPVKENVEKYFEGEKIIKSKYTPVLFIIADRTTSLFSLKKAGASANQRFLIWLSAWDITKNQPFLGNGWGLFELLYPFYQGRILSVERLRARTHANNAHNAIMEYLSQVGIIGFGIFIWLAVNMIFYGFHLIKNTKNSFSRLIVISIIAGTVGLFIDNLLNVSLYFVIPAFFFWINLGLMNNIAQANTASNNKTYTLNPTIKYLFFLILPICVLIVWMNFSFFFSEINYFKGFKLSKTSNMVDKAIFYLEKAHGFHRLEVNINYELGNCYARMRDVDPQNKEKWQEKSLWAYNEALAANPGYDEIYFNMATVYAQMKKYALSVENYRKAIYINPLSYDAHMGLSSILIGSGTEKDLIEVTKLYERVSLFHPKNKDVLNNLGYVYTRLGKFDKAILSYEKALEIDPNFELAKINLSNALKKIGKLSTNQSKQLEVINLEIEGKKAIDQKRWEDALRIYKRISSVQPNNSNADFFVGNLLFTLGRHNESIPYYKKAIELSPKNTSALNNLGLVFIELKKYNDAKKCFETVLTIDPTDKIANDSLKRLKLLGEG